MAVVDRTNPLARWWANSGLVTQWVLAAGVAALLVETVNYLIPNRDSLLDIACVAISFLVPTIAQTLVLGRHFRELRPKQLERIFPPKPRRGDTGSKCKCLDMSNSPYAMDQTSLYRRVGPRIHEV